VRRRCPEGSVYRFLARERTRLFRSELDPRVVYRDSAYGTGAHLVWLRQHGLTPMVTTQIPTAPGDRYPMNQFRIDLQAGR
jgi:hypothetical protein